MFFFFTPARMVIEESMILHESGVSLSLTWNQELSTDDRSFSRVFNQCVFVCYVCDSGAAPTERCATSCPQLLVQPSSTSPQLVPIPGASLAPSAPQRWNQG